MGTCLDRGIKVVSNAGGLDPDGCAEAVAEVAADRLGLAPTIAYVNGDDLLRRLDELVAAGVDLAHFDTGEPLGDISRFISANAYLGCWGIVEALERGADIVITGRATDAAVVCGPAAWHHGWAARRLGRAGGRGRGRPHHRVRHAGHRRQLLVLHRGAGPDPHRLPVRRDRRRRLVRRSASTTAPAARSPSARSPSQLLYEIASPAYLNPDVTAASTRSSSSRSGATGCGSAGTLGEPPPPTLKVAMNEWGGFRNDVTIALTGLDIEAKAELIEAAFWDACPSKPDDFDSVTAKLVRTDKDDPATQRRGRRHVAAHAEGPRRAQGRAGHLRRRRRAGPGHHPGLLQLRRRHRSPAPTACTARRSCPPTSCRSTWSSSAVSAPWSTRSPRGRGATSRGSARPAARPRPAAHASPDRARRRDPVGRQGGQRQPRRVRPHRRGLGVARRLPDDRRGARACCPRRRRLAIQRYRLPAIRSLNFVIVGLLQEGVAASTRHDGQAKSLGEWLRARHVDIPSALLESR